MATKTVIVRNAFSNMTGTYRATADKDGTVRVYDSVAGYWTICHNLSERQMARVRRWMRG